MFNRNIIAKAIAITALGFSSAAANAYTITFDNLGTGTQANQDQVAINNGVTFLSGYLTPDLDGQGYEILDSYGQPIPGFQHWTSYNDSNIVVGNPADSGWGVAPSGPNAIDGRWDQVLVTFASAVNLSSFSFKTDSSSYGFPGNLPVQFLDANGKPVASVDFYQDTDHFVTANFAGGLTVNGVLLSGGKFYDDITVTPVPEPESWAMLTGGLLLMGAVVRRRRG